MPEEVAILFFMLIMSVFGLIMTSMILRHRRKQKSGSSSGSDSSMTTSELESMMRRAVEDATAPLTAKIEDLEMEIIKSGTAPKALEAHDASSRIRIDEEDEVLDVEPVAAPSKTRS